MDINQIKELRGDTSESEVIKRAREDFRYVCSQANLTASSYMNTQELMRGSEKIARVLAIPFNVEERVSVFNASSIEKNNPKMFVAAVCYRGGAPINVLMFNAAALPGKNFKYNKKTDEYSLKIKDINHKSMQQYAFGYVIKNL